MPDQQELRKTPFHDRHVAMEARMGELAGWQVPLSFRGAFEEAAEVRRRAGLFDVTPIGRLRIRGDGAVDLLSHLCTHDVETQPDNTAALTLLCDESGGILDICMLLRLESFWVLTTSPCNREKILQHLTAHAEDFGARVDDQTEITCQVAVAGPEAGALLDAVLPEPVSQMSRRQVYVGSLMLARYIAMRTGCTGGWGIEVILPNMFAGRAWDFATRKAGERAIPPIGEAAREILRVEAGLPAYGHEIDETVNPAMAGLMHLVHDGKDFLGAEAVAKLRDKGSQRQLVGIAAKLPSESPAEAAIPRMGTSVLRADGNHAGSVTSGTYSPNLEKLLLLAYVTPESAEAGTKLCLPSRDDLIPGEVAELPFVKAS
ncbi:MAG: aminomethyltransferase family protein [Phycisphaerae bacterium]